MKTQSNRIVLAVIACLLAANLLVMVNAGSSRSAMAAGIPDSGAQMQAVVDQMVELNKRVDKLQDFLESGKIIVNVKDPKTDK